LNNVEHCHGDYEQIRRQNIGTRLLYLTD